MRTNAAGINLIKNFEAFSSKPYGDVVGIRTIYWGHVIRLEDPPFDGTREQGEEYLRKDLLSAESSVARLIAVPITGNQHAALVSFTFNLGGGNLQASTLRSKLNRGDYMGAADQFPRWVYAGGRLFRGLLRRRNAERALFLTSDGVLNE